MDRISLITGFIFTLCMNIYTVSAEKSERIDCIKGDTVEIRCATVPWSMAVDSLRDCDLLFQSSRSANAITDVTRGVAGMNIDHVGVFARLGGKPSVIEALPGRGVCITPIDSFMVRGASGGTCRPVAVGRVTSNLDFDVSLYRVSCFIGSRYDSLYLPDNKEIYCSELVQLSFLDKDKNLIFDTVPMTFRDETGSVPDYWKRFYARHGMPVPEGKPGTNPGEMSRRKNVRIVMIMR
ncbi:YiiX/YebB-like N1pC/P60 family cysteine hydrolase [Xylanibacter caecicola]|uniref:YiiX/YebB-like N1pC/P60 family cysteine hydrolase n=1 Tax=Xylanibacter caecicola TaxID=2736294 RepID=UPI00258F74A7|nr:YiiX/YebB-like N1pC/P60 family cysteine hydrolase [Xylanibacter caecicola]